MTVVERFYLENNSHLTVNEMAHALQKTEEVVETYLAILKQEKYEQERGGVAKQEEAVAKRKPGRPKKSSPLLNSFARKKNGGTVAMTGTAAMISDELEKKSRGKTLHEQRPDCVTTCIPPDAKK